jgi:hypothetical protein
MIWPRLAYPVIFALALLHPITAHAFTLQVSSSGGGGSWKDGTYTVTVGAKVRFTCSPSGGTRPYTYAWDFDDVETYKNPDSSRNPTHTFDLPGIHNIWVTVIDDASQKERAYLRVHVKDSLTEYDAITDGGLIDDNSTDNGPALRRLIDKDDDGEYRIFFRRTKRGIYRITSTTSPEADKNVAVDFGSDRKVEFVGEPGVVIKFDPKDSADSFFYFRNEDTRKYALFQDLAFEGDGNTYMISRMMRKGKQYQIWRNCDFYNVRKLSRNNRDIVIRGNFEKWGKDTANLNYSYSNSLWKLLLQ